MSDSGRRFPEDYTIAELHAIATRALANGDEYERGLLREQFMREEFGEEPEILPEDEVASDAWREPRRYCTCLGFMDPEASQ